MAKLSDEEQQQLDALLSKKDAPDEPASSPQQRTNVNVTIDLENEQQVKRAVKSGLLPASYLDDDEDDDDDGKKDDDDDDDRGVKKDRPPARRLDRRYS